MVGERETPAWQWMRTPELSRLARSMKANASSKNCLRFYGKGKEKDLVRSSA